MNARIPIVNEQDEIIGERVRKELQPGDIFRVTGLWIYDADGNILLARRAETKALHPGLWALGVAGTVEIGETYDNNIVKEMEEEIGLTGYVPTFISKELRDNQSGLGLRRFAAHYSVTIPHDYLFKIKEDEVAEIKWFTPKEIEEAVSKNPAMFVPTFLMYYKDFMYANTNR
jgi:isopentenyldiphosphate isomerase